LAREIALNHHERWDGQGYPSGLSGESIPMAARIVSIVNAYDALTHDRVYRHAFPEDEALRMMHQQMGTQFVLLRPGGVPVFSFFFTNPARRVESNIRKLFMGR